MDRFCYTYKYFPIQVDAALKILNRAGYIEYTEEQDSQARVMFTIERDDLYLLKNVTPNEDHVIITLLRNYSGLFTDFQYIDESFLASQNDLSLTEVYLILKGLAMRNIIQFIPQKRTPYIRYAQRREESRHLLFPPEVYEELKTRFIERISAIQDYMDNDQVCHSRQLLRYFGEENSHDCGHCDVCLEHKTDTHLPDASLQILNLLVDHRTRPVADLYTLPFPSPTIDKALSELIKEEAIINDDGLLSLP
jgi:ATP-dependent DNA helicase RecQ